MSDAVAVAALAAAATVIAALLGYLGVRVNKAIGHAKSAADDSAATKEQVQNSHTTNLREESDTRHDEVMAAISDIQGAQATTARALDEVKASQSGLKRDIGRLADADLEHTKAAREDRVRLSKHIDDSIAGLPGKKE